MSWEIKRQLPIRCINISLLADFICAMFYNLQNEQQLSKEFLSVMKTAENDYQVTYFSQFN